MKKKVAMLLTLVMVCFCGLAFSSCTETEKQISLTKTNVEMKVGDTHDIAVEAKNDNVKKDEITYQVTLGSDLITLSGAKITAKAIGNAQVMVSYGADQLFFEVVVKADKTKVEELQAQIDAIKADLTAANEKVTALETRMTAAETAATELAGKVTALETRMTAAETKATELAGKVTELETALGAAKTELKALIDAKAPQSELDAAEARIAVIEGQLNGEDGALAKLAAAETEIEAIDEALNGTDGALAKLAAAQAEIGTIDAALKTAVGDIATLKSDLKTKTDAFDKYIKDTKDADTLAATKAADLKKEFDTYGAGNYLDEEYQNLIYTCDYYYGYILRSSSIEEVNARFAEALEKFDAIPTKFQSVETLIEAIGKVYYAPEGVTVPAGVTDRGEAINTAKTAYDELDEANKKLVNKDLVGVLNAAIESYATQKSVYTEAQKIVAQIKALPDASADQIGADTTAAKDAYDTWFANSKIDKYNETTAALLKAYVANYDVLVDALAAKPVAEAAFAVLADGVVDKTSEAELTKVKDFFSKLTAAQKKFYAVYDAPKFEDLDAAINVYNLINKIGSVEIGTIDANQIAIEAARAAYDKLKANATALGYVSTDTYEILTVAEVKYEEVRFTQYKDGIFDDMKDAASKIKALTNDPDVKNKVDGALGTWLTNLAEKITHTYGNLYEKVGGREAETVQTDQMLADAKVAMYNELGIQPDAGDKVSYTIYAPAGETVLTKESFGGNAVLDELHIFYSVGDGDVRISGIEIGNLFVNGGGANSIHLVDCDITGNLVIAREEGLVNVVIEGDSSVENLEANKSATLNIVSTATVTAVTVKQDASLTLTGGKPASLTVTKEDGTTDTFTKPEDMPVAVVSNEEMILLAVANAKAGDTIVISAGTHTFEKTIVITKDINFVGEGSSKTIVKVASITPTDKLKNVYRGGGNMFPIVMIEEAKVSFTGITFDALTETYTGIDGIIAIASELSMTDVEIKDVRPSNEDRRGMLWGVALTAWDNGTESKLTLDNVSITGFQKNGVLVIGAKQTAAIKNAVITGRKFKDITANDCAANGIVAMNGAYVSVRNASISNLTYDFNGTQSVGLYAAGKGTKIVYDDVTFTDVAKNVEADENAFVLTSAEYEEAFEDSVVPSVTQWYNYNGEMYLDTSFTFDNRLYGYDTFKSIRMELFDKGGVSMGYALSEGANLETLLADCEQYWGADSYRVLTISNAFKNRAEASDNGFWYRSAFAGTVDGAQPASMTVTVTLKDGKTYTVSEDGFAPSAGSDVAVVSDAAEFNAALAGSASTIYMKAGSYDLGHVEITRAVTIIGSGDTTVVTVSEDKISGQAGVYVKSSNVVLGNLKIVSGEDSLSALKVSNNSNGTEPENVAFNGLTIVGGKGVNIHNAKNVTVNACRISVEAAVRTVALSIRNATVTVSASVINSGAWGCVGIMHGASDAAGSTVTFENSMIDSVYVEDFATGNSSIVGLDGWKKTVAGTIAVYTPVMTGSITNWYGTDNAYLDTSVTFDSDVIEYKKISKIEFSLFDRTGSLIGSAVSAGKNLTALIKDCEQYWLDGDGTLLGKNITLSNAFQFRTEENDNGYWVRSAFSAGADNGVVPSILTVTFTMEDGTVFTGSYIK